MNANELTLLERNVGVTCDEEANKIVIWCAGIRDSDVVGKQIGFRWISVWRLGQTTPFPINVLHNEGCVLLRFCVVAECYEEATWIKIFAVSSVRSVTDWNLRSEIRYELTLVSALQLT